MSVAALILSMSLGLPAGQIAQHEMQIPAIQTYDNGLAYRATKRVRATGAYPELGLQCAGRTVRFGFTGLPLDHDRHQDIQITIGDWSRPLNRAQASDMWAQIATSASLISAIGSGRPVEMRFEGRTYRMQPLAREQHAAFARWCAQEAEASIGTHPPQAVLRDPPLID